MDKLSKYFFLFLSILILSCRKDKTPTPTQNNPVETTDTIFLVNHSNDTIFPSDYLMTYPGSWWIYDNGNTYHCDNWQPFLIYTTTTNNNETIISEDQVFLPYSNELPFSIYAPSNIYKNKKITTDSENKITSYNQIIDENIGVFYEGPPKEEAPGVYKKWIKQTIERLDSITVGTFTFYDVLFIRYGNVYNDNLNDLEITSITDYFFAKNVGLVKWVNYTYEYHVEHKIVNYYIAPH